MSPSTPRSEPSLPEWAKELPLSKKNQRILARVLKDRTKDVSRQIEGLLQLGETLEEFLADVRQIVEQGDQFLREGVELARKFKVPEADLAFAFGAIRGHSCNELRDVIKDIERLKRVADRIKDHQDPGISRGAAEKIREGMDATTEKVKDESCEDRGHTVFQIVENIYQRMLSENPAPLTQETFPAFLKKFTWRAMQSVRRKRVKGPRVRKEIRDPKIRPQIEAEVSRMCSMILLKDFALRKIVKYSPVMISALQRQVPPVADMESIGADYRNLRNLPQYSRAVVMAGPQQTSFYLEGETEEDRQKEIHPDIVQACTGAAPMRVVRAEFMSDSDVFLLRDALHPRDVLHATIAAPHPFAGRAVTIRSTIKNELEVIDIAGEENAEAKAALQEQINRQPLKVLEADFCVDWAEQAESS